MNITEILTQAQQSSDAVTDLLIELAQQNKEVSATAQHMCDLYFADVRLREKGIRDTLDMFPWSFLSALVTSRAGGDLAAVEAEFAVDQLIHEAGAVKADIVPIGGLVHGRAVEGARLAKAAVLVDLVGVDLVQNADLLGIEAALVSDKRLGLLVGHRLAAVGKVGVVVLAHVRAGTIAGLPFKLTVQLGGQLVDSIFTVGHILLVLPLALQQQAVQPVDLGGSGLAELPRPAVLDESLTKGVLVTVEVVIGFFDLGVLFGGRLEAGAVDKLGHHHFAFLLDFSALLGYNQGGGSKASRSPFGVL